MNTYKTFAVMVIVALLLSACASTSTPTPMVPVTGATPESIGEISAEKTLVESGPSEALARVSDTQNFFNNDTVRVTNGGTAKLDFFVNQISIRLFNDTAVGDVKADPSGTPDRAVRMKLVFGGLSGEVAKNGIPIQFEITNGVNIYILGTQFLVLYDPESSTTYIGNFDGTIAYTTPGQPSVQFIQAGQLYEISPSFETRTMIMNFTRTEIETRTLETRSTLLATLEGYLEPALTSTPTPNSTFTSTPTPIPTITPTPTRITPCDKAAFVTDVTIPDGTPFTPGFQFTKVWRLRNVGTCTWTNGYSLVFYRGEQMGGPTSVNIPSTVAPGQTVDVAVGLVAPALPGSYRGEWMLRGPSGALFGAGANGTTPIWVKINVINPVTTTLAGLPDLTVLTNNFISACPTSPVLTTPTTTQIASPTPTPCPSSYSVGFVITNTGSVGVTSNFQVLIEVTDSGITIVSKMITVNGLAAGGSQSFSEALAAFCPSANCAARVTVDSSNIIQESNESNNISVKAINT